MADYQAIRRQGIRNGALFFLLLCVMKKVTIIDIFDVVGNENLI